MSPLPRMWVARSEIGPRDAYLILELFDRTLEEAEAHEDTVGADSIVSRTVEAVILFVAPP